MEQEPDAAKEEISSASNACLDFTSPGFDALKALQTDPSQIRLPFPAVQPCDNLDAYHSVVTGTRRKPTTKTQSDDIVTHGNVGVAQPDQCHGNVGVVPPDQGRGIVDLAQPDQGRGKVGVALPAEQKGGAMSQARSREGKGHGFVTVLDYMQKCDLGPLELLGMCRRDGVTVRVWIRHCVGVRGVCDGVPIAFDRHMNVVLRDVVEHYVPFRTVANGGVSEGRKRKKKKSKKKLLTSEEDVRTEVASDHTPLSSASSSCSHVTPKSVTRHLKQLFIRGDNIIMICRPSQVT